MSTLSELSVRIRADKADLDRGMVEVQATLRQTASEGERSGGRMERAFHGVSGALDRMLGIAMRATAAMAGFGLLVGGVVGKQAEDAALSYDELSARLDAVAGSADAAARKLDFAQKVANPSNFTFRQLADATVTLQAFGINAERALPTVARLGMAFGAGNEQLQMMVRGLGDLASGKFPDADVMASFGLNRDMFKEKGIKFDGQGQLQSSALETFNALEKIVNERYGKIFDQMANKTGAKLASLQDSWEKVLRTMGGGILTILTPAIEKLTGMLNALNKSGVLQDVVTRFVAGIKDLTHIDLSSGGITKFVAATMSVISNLPKNLKEIGTYASAVFSVVFENISKLVSYVAKNVNAVMSLFQGSRKGAGGGYDFGSDAGDFGGPDAKGVMQGSFFGSGILGWLLKASGPKGTLGEEILSAIGGSVPGGIDAPTFKSLPGLPKFTDPLSNMARYQQMLEGAMKTPDSNAVPSARGGWMERAAKATEAMEQHTQQIERHTQDTKDILSLRRQALGGGSQGQIGATPIEMFGGAPTRTVQAHAFVQVGDVSSTWDRAIKQIVQGAVLGPGGKGFRPR